MADRPRDFYLLGAGFSRAVSLQMPAMAELRDAVLTEAEVPSVDLDAFGGDLEQWLSHLSTDQPWLAEAQNLRNRARFTEISQAIATVIERAEAAVGECPHWLTRLALTWRSNEATIATLNYDLLPERAITELGGIQMASDLYGISLSRRSAPGDTETFGSEDATFSLPTMFKLHGSTNWRFSGERGSPSDPVVLSRYLMGWRAPAAPSSPRRRGQFLLDDLVPLIVPPTSIKTAFYSNLALRAQWYRAAQRLSDADRVIIIGYSFPPGDVQMRQFVATSLQGAEVIVVDRERERPGEISRLVGRRIARSFTGEKAVEEFVSAECASFVRCSSAVDEQDGRIRSSIALDGLTVWTADSMTGESMDEALEQCKQEADRRWPGIRERLEWDRSSSLVAQP